MRSKAIPTWLDRENKDDGSPYLAVEYNQRRFLLNFIDTGIRITAVYTVPWKSLPDYSRCRDYGSFYQNGGL